MNLITHTREKHRNREKERGGIYIRPEGRHEECHGQKIKRGRMILIMQRDKGRYLVWIDLLMFQALRSVPLLTHQGIDLEL
jgi:hypothetical protein